MKRVLNIATVLAAGTAASAWFLATTEATGLVADGVLLAFALVAGSVLVLPAVGWPRQHAEARASRLDVVRMGLAGVAVFAAAPLIALLSRRTDAPSGSESLFFTTAAWGVLVVLAATIASRRRPLVPVAGALVALLGAAAVVANWERPSSFSPFMKFPLAEVAMLGAGVVFALGSVELARGIRRHGTRFSLGVAWLAAVPVGLLAGIVSAFESGGLSQAFGDVARELPSLSWAAFGLAAFALAWCAAIRRVGTTRAAAAMFLPPVVLTATAAASHAVRAYGPDPIQWAGVAGGAILLLVGITALIEPAEQAEASRPDSWGRVAAGLSLMAAVFGVAALAVPAFNAQVQGSPNGAEFAAHWTIPGFLAASGWAPLLAALLILGTALDARRFSWELAARTSGLAAALLIIVSMPLLANTPLATWNGWLPTDVLQELGTEYARLDVASVTQPLSWIALGLAALAAGVLVAAAVAGRTNLVGRLEDQA